MDRRFGVKDGILALLVIAVGSLVVLAMVQEDRRWAEVRALRTAVADQTRLLADIERALRRGDSAPWSLDPPAHDDAWAKPGVPITRPPAWTVASDPRAHPDFAEGGTLTEIFEGNTQRLTPYLANDAFSYRIVYEAVCESLAAYDSRTLDLRGWLADAWQYDPAGLWLRVKIHDAARFSDGAPVTAEDVRFTVMDYVLNPAVNTGPFRSEFGAIASVEVISPKVVEFRFKEPRAANLRAALRNVVLPAHYYKQFTSEALNVSTALLMGSGPYRLDGVDPASPWKPGSEVLLVRNERYWSDRPPIERLRFTFIPDATARLASFEAGRGDLMRSTPEQHAAKSRDPAFTRDARALSWINMRSGYTILAWNCGERNGRPTPFADARVRRAMTLALDRDRMIRDFYEGLGLPSTGPFTTGQGDPDIKPWPYDLERARALLAEAGWIDRNSDSVIEDPSGRPLEWELTYAKGSVMGERASPYIIDQCARLGVRVITRVVDAATFADLRARHDFDALPVQWSWSGPEYDAFQTLHSSQIEGGDNWIQWRNSEADSIIERIRVTLDPAARADLTRHLHRIIHDEQPCTYLFNVPWTRFVSARVRNVHTYPVGLDRREPFIPAALQ